MIRKALLLLVGLLLLLTGTEGAPKKSEAKKKRSRGHWWVTELKTTEDDYHVSRLRPVTPILDWQGTSQQPQKNCHVSAGRVVASSGEIRIGRYSNAEHCLWEIQVPEGMTIKFTWQYLDLEGPNPSCPYDFVDISEYATGKTLTGRVCGSEVPQPITSRSNLVAVTFKSDDSVTLQGFWLMFEAIAVTTASGQSETTQPLETTTDFYERTQLPHMNCSVDAGRVVGLTGEITTRGHNGTYNNNELCVWEIQVPEGMVINFTWEAFDLEGHSPGCPYDYVDITDYATEESLTGRLCGSNIPPSAVSPTNSVKVTFLSDASVSLQGFTLKFEAIPAVTTTPDHYETTVSTKTTTRHWHQTQLPGVSCRIDAGRVVGLTGEITTRGHNGTYNNNELCVWEIQVPEGMVINFTWEAFDLEGHSPGCPYDYVDISEHATGESLTGRLCGSNIPPPLESRSNFVVVTFKTDASVTLKGFTMKFEAIPVTTTPDLYETTVRTETTRTHWHETTQLPQKNCSVDAGRVVGLTGEITTGVHDGTYNNNEFCIWEIEVPEGMGINFTWEAFDLEGNSPECPYDFVDVSGHVMGESLTGRLCGSNIPPPVVSSSNFAVVTFKSDASVTLRGFTLKFEAISVMVHGK